MSFLATLLIGWVLLCAVIFVPVFYLVRKAENQNKLETGRRDQTIKRIRVRKSSIYDLTILLSRYDDNEEKLFEIIDQLDQWNLTHDEWERAESYMRGGRAHRKGREWIVERRLGLIKQRMVTSDAPNN